MGGHEPGEEGTRTPSWDLREYRGVDSTNLEAKRLLRSGASAGLVVTALHQTGGRGRMGRGWLDLPGKSLLASLALGDVGGFEASMLVALSARAAIVAAGGEGPSFKWPNDLVYGRGKVGGILSEAYGAKSGPNEPRGRAGAGLTIVGIGLNLGYLPGELDIPAKLPPTSLLIEEGKIWDAGELLRGLLREFEARWGSAREEWMMEYRENLAYLGETVKVSPPHTLLEGPGTQGEFEAVLLGVDEDGNLLLGVGEKILRLASGDVHLP